MDETVLQDRLGKIHEWLQKEFSAIRTGQAAPAILDSVKVESYGTHMPVNQVGSIGIEDARTLRVSPWDTSMIATIERAIRDADLGVSVVTDSSGLRVIFHELTSERSEQLIKLAKQKLEEARVSIRSARDEAIKDIEGKQKAGELSEDEKFSVKERIQKHVEAANEKLDALFKGKEAEIGG